MSVSALFISLQFDQAVIVASEQELPFLMILSFIICSLWFLVAVLLIAIVPFVFHDSLLSSFALDWTLPPLIFTYGVFNLLLNYRLRRNHVIQVGFGRVIYYGGGAILQVVCATLFRPIRSVYLLVQIGICTIVILYLFPYAGMLRLAVRPMDIKLTVKNLATVGKRHAKFPRYQMGAQVIDAFSLQMPIFFLRIFYSDAWAGWYFMASRLLQGPTTLVSQAVGALFYRDSAEKHRSNIGQSKTVENVVGGLLRISLLPMMLLAVVVTPIVDRFFGGTWAPVAVIVQVSLPAALATMVTSPISGYMNVRGMQAATLTFQIAITLARIIGLATGLWLGSAIASVAGFSLGMFVATFFFCRYIVKSAGGSFALVLKDVLPHSLEVLALSVIAIVLSIEGLLFTLVGAITMTIGVGFVVWREFQRGGFTMVPRLPPREAKGE